MTARVYVGFARHVNGPAGLVAVRCTRCKHMAWTHEPLHPTDPPGCQAYEPPKGFDHKRAWMNNAPTIVVRGAIAEQPFEDMTEGFLERCGCRALERKRA